MASSPAVFTIQMTAFWHAHMPITARQIGILPCKDEPKTPLPRPEMPVARCEISAGGQRKTSRQRPPQSSPKAPFWPHMRALPKPQPPARHLPHTVRECHRTTIPTRLHHAKLLSVQRLFMAVATNPHSKMRQGWKPEGLSPQSGFGSSQPGARGCPRAGAHTVSANQLNQPKDANSFFELKDNCLGGKAGSRYRFPSNVASNPFAPFLICVNVNGSTHKVTVIEKCLNKVVHSVHFTICQKNAA